MNRASVEVCQACLNIDRRLDSIININNLLQELDVHFRYEEGGICWVCKTILFKFFKLKKQILRAQEFLEHKDATCFNSLISVNNVCIDIPPGSQIYEEKDLKEKAENVFSNNEMVENSLQDVFVEESRTQSEWLKFEVHTLSLEHQLKEIEIKLNSDKYTERSYKCVKCGVGFLSSDVYEEHLRRHDSSSGPFACSVCHLRFKSRLVLSQHALAHRRRFKCLVCGDIVKRWSQAVSHRRKCDNILDTAVCGYCSKVFSDSNSLHTHIKSVHKKEKKYVCEQCSKTFVTKQRLCVHMRSHTGYKPFRCTDCGKCFTTASNLRSHGTVHRSEKSYHCVECNTLYKTEKSLKKHFLESVKHTKDNNLRYRCTECHKQFGTESALLSHVNNRHETSYRCSICDKNFTTNSNLKKHYRSVHKTDTVIK